MSSSSKRTSSDAELSEPPQKQANLSDPLPGEWRYIQGPDHTVYIIHMPTLQLHAPECHVTKILLKDTTKGLVDTDPVFVSAPTWYVEQVCNISQVYSSRFASFPGQDMGPVCDVLMKLGWQPNGDLRIPHVWATEIENRNRQLIDSTQKGKRLQALLRFYCVDIPMPTLSREPVAMHVKSKLVGLSAKAVRREIIELVTNGCSQFDTVVNDVAYTIRVRLNTELIEENELDIEITPK